MNGETFENLSDIQTSWTDLRLAHRNGPAESPEEVRQAQSRLLKRYQGAIVRYVRAAVGDEEEAEELFQNFSLRFLKGDFRRADPGRGRFRDYLKTALFHLVSDHARQARKRPGPLPSGFVEPWNDDSPTDEEHRRFAELWRAELLARAWAALDDLERRTGEPLASLLRYRIKHPKSRSSEMAEMFSARFGRELKAETIRKTLYRARGIFRERIVREVAETLDSPSLSAVEEELIDLGLHEYLRSDLDRMKGHRPDSRPSVKSGNRDRPPDPSPLDSAASDPRS